MKRFFGALCLLAGMALAQSGTQIYQQNCAFCHGDNGQGRVGAFPPLATHAVDLVKLELGRSHLINVLLYGMHGPIKARGNTYNGVMPAFAQLSDEQIASVLNHILLAWGNDKQLSKDHRPLSPAEVATARGTRLTPQQVGANRSKISVP